MSEQHISEEKEHREKNESESVSESENTEHTEFQDNENEDTETSKVKKIIPGVIYLSRTCSNLTLYLKETFLPFGFRKAGRVRCGGARETH